VRACVPIALLDMNLRDYFTQQLDTDASAAFHVTSATPTSSLCSLAIWMFKSRGHDPGAIV
jgi:hypothetical protein